MLEMGSVSADQMYAKARSRSKALTWILRLVGFLLMAFGIGMVLAPLAVLGDVIPFIGNLLETGIALVAGLIALVLSLVTVAVAWLVFRPILGIFFLLVAGGAVVLLVQLNRKRAAKATPAPAED